MTSMIYSGWSIIPDIGTYVEANHPITILNPSQFFEVRYVDFRNGRWCVRGENTCWFAVNSVRPVSVENMIAQTEMDMRHERK